MDPVKCVGVGVENFSKNTHVRCGSVQSEKLLCAECADLPELAAHKYSDFQGLELKWDYPTIYCMVGSLSGGDADVIRKWPFSCRSFLSLLWTLHSCLQGQENVGGVRASSH